MSARQLLVVGGGLSSARLVARYREEGGEDDVTLVSADTAPPYHRPPLSKRFLRAEIEAPDTFVQPEEFYAEHRIELRLATRAERIADGAVELEGGKRLPFDRLVVAAGARPRRLPVPGTDLDGVRTLRTLDDSRALRERAPRTRHAVVVGGSFIGSEVAASLRTLGVDVTLVHRGTGLFDVLGVRELSDALARLYAERGVELVFGDSVAQFAGNGSLERVRTTGGRELETDLAVQGVGVAINVEWLDGSGVEVDDGVVVDERFASSVPGVFAVGDIARVPDPDAGRHRRIEHWSNANVHGGRLGALLAGVDPGEPPVASFFSEVFGLSFRVFGDAERYDTVETRGSFDDGRAAALYARDGVLVGALVLGQPEEVENALKEAIRGKRQASAVEV